MPHGGLSTDSPEDLSRLESPNFKLLWCSKPEETQTLGTILEHPNSWHITGRYGGCSCHMRHLIRETPEKDFHEPYDWCPEDPEDIEDTAAIYEVLRRIVDGGNNLDVVDLWNGGIGDDFVTVIAVSLAEVNREQFLLMENRRLALAP